MRITRIVTGTLWLLLYANLLVTAQQRVEVGEGEHRVIGRQIEYFVDTTSELTIDQAVNQRFLTSEFDVLNLGNTPHSVWLRFSVLSKTDKGLYLDINAPLLHELEVYAARMETPKLIFSGGSGQPFINRPINLETWLLDLELNNGEEATIYIRGSSYYPFQIPVTISARNRFVEDNQLHNLFWGIYMGVMLFAFLYNFFIYVSVRDLSYLYYLLYILSSVAFYLGLEGYGFKFIWPGQPGFNPLIPVLVSITNIVITLFALRFLQIGRDQRVLFYTGWFIIIIMVLIALLDLAGVYAEALAMSQGFSFLACVYFIIAGVVSLRRGIKTAKYFLLAWSVFLILVILFILALNNVVPSTFFTTRGIFLGHMTEVLLLSFALADRINVLKRENEKKQKEIIVQLEANQKLQTKVNRELEQKVRERTAEVVAQKERSDELLLNILPSEVAEELKTSGSTQAQYMNQVTVMFTDFFDFTKLSEQLTAKELVAQLNHCFSAFDGIMIKYGIEKIKTIGDSYMAAGGLPTPSPRHAENVVQACLEIQKFLNDYKQQRMAEGKPYFETRIGVHSGPVVAGIVGVKKFAYDIWGDTVNIASRMETSGECGRVNISQSTYELVKDTFDCTYRGKISAKGKGELDMYFVDREKVVQS